MQINPTTQEYSEIVDKEEVLKQLNEIKESLHETDEQSVLAQGSKEQLQKLQDDLRKLGYRKQ